MKLELELSLAYDIFVVIAWADLWSTFPDGWRSKSDNNAISALRCSYS